MNNEIVRKIIINIKNTIDNYSNKKIEGCYEEVLRIRDSYEKHLSELYHCKNHEKLDEDCQECMDNYDGISNKLIFNEIQKIIMQVEKHK